MKLLDEIIDLLSDENGSLTAALLKTTVLMHRIGHAELAEWVNNELNGYPKDKPVPDYRITRGRVVGMVQNMVMIYNSLDLPTGHLPEKLRKYLEQHEMREAMSVLEDFSKGTGHLQMPLEPAVTLAIGEALAEGHFVQKAWVEMQPSQIKNGLAKVRARLLDFALKLQDELGETKEDQVKEAASKTDVSAMFHGAVFGDHTTVVIGNHNTTTVKNTVKKGDFDSLAKLLQDKGVAGSDIAELDAAIRADGTLIDPKAGFGKSVKTWMTKMLGKAVDASWQIELGIAGNLLTDALKAFYFS
jgi:AbiTii